LAVNTDTDPVVDTLLPPPTIVTEPPMADAADVVPAASVKSPPAPLVPEPTAMVIPPPRPNVADPLDTVTAPEFPLAEVPVEIRIAPETPDAVTSAVETATLPVPVAPLPPLVTTMEPPTPV
jgi:hypothetical protein